MLSDGLVELKPFVDMHVHCREPGNNPAETIETATEAAADGGVGTINDMPNNAPDPTSTEAFIDVKRHRARQTSVVNYGAALGIQPEYDNVGEIERALDKALLAKAYGGPTTNINRTTDYEAQEFDEVLDRIRLVNPDKLVVFHSGEDNYRDFIGHAAGDRELRVQLAHVNKMDQVLAVKEAKTRGWDVEASICPHTMLLTDRDRQTRSSFADMQPPLVHADDAYELFQAFVNGRIMDLETDHAPHTYDAKMVAVEANPACSSNEHSMRCCGVPGLELGSKVMLWQVRLGNLPLERLEEAYSTHPADRLHLKSGDDSRVIWDMKTYRIDDEFEQVRSLSGWTPYLGMMAVGIVQEMTLSGQVVYEKGEVVNPLRRVVTGNYEVI
ncbi:MAG TPA: dihydroorotase family protein [Candidatus Saccharimonadales bacterium]|nr:dihydroorotase family protein [Candidatus Saccharimonadales bacterium]